MAKLTALRTDIRNLHLCDEATRIDDLIRSTALSIKSRRAIVHDAARIVKDIRTEKNPGLMEVFLAEYGLNTQEGVALMCLAEALLRVPDKDTIDDLIEDKISDHNWLSHLGKSSSALVNTSTWGLMLTGKVLSTDDEQRVAPNLRAMIKRLGEPVIRRAVRSALKELGNQFVLGETIEAAVKRGANLESRGYTHSYDMLGEAALTDADALAFVASYSDAISFLARQSKSDDVRQNPGISIKLSALYPRYELAHKNGVMDVLVGRTLELVLQARAANMGLNIDAEEADRLDLSLDVIEAVLSDERLAGWDGFGVVVQAYGKRASSVLDWLNALAKTHDRKIMVRLVKGAYWDTEIKRAQVDGISDFPVFTRKSASDISYIACARQLLGMGARIYPQFATHNAHSVQSVLAMAPAVAAYEFQRLHGMGEALYRQVLANNDVTCRIYAPVGVHDDLLAYLVRRLLENGANSSFVNQIVDATVPAEIVVADPFEEWETTRDQKSAAVVPPAKLFAPQRPNSIGYDTTSVTDLSRIQAEMEKFLDTTWNVGAQLVSGKARGETLTHTNPAIPSDVVGAATQADIEDVEDAIAAAKPWNAPLKERARILNRAADLYEENHAELFSILTREAGKTLKDAIAELREAVDFLRYYAAQAALHTNRKPCGVFACISPWNFPLAIFTGQIAAAVSVGNAVLAKPAEPTPIIAARAVEFLHEAGVPRAALQLLIGSGREVGARIVSDPRVNGVCFTGSTTTAQHINLDVAAKGQADAPMIAETGGLNAMVVDSTALPQQAINDIIASAFQSAGQRCSALRILYLQEDIAPHFMKMLFGAMDAQMVGNPWDVACDIGPVITQTAMAGIMAHIEKAALEGRLLHQISAPDEGIFVPPSVIKITGVADMTEEVFGPVLHLATFKSSELDKVVSAINASQYGLTFGVHSRIDTRIEQLCNSLNVGNIYVNRNQIGAIVGSQPFGGEGLSGTGPKAGGPSYLSRFVKPDPAPITQLPAATDIAGKVQTVLNELPLTDRTPLETKMLPGPTGEKNQLSSYPRGTVLCLGPGIEPACLQAKMATAVGCKGVIIAAGARPGEGIDGTLDLSTLETLTGFDAVVLWAGEDALRFARAALARRDGALIPLIHARDLGERCVIERHVCFDTTAAGGNAALLAAQS